MPRIVNPQVISAFTAEGAATQYQAVTTGTADTQVDCTASVTVGRRTHVGRRAQVFTHAHDVSRRSVPVLEAPVTSASVVIGDDVTIGHKVLVHGCTIEDRVLIGMGSTLMDGAVIRSEVLLGAGSLVVEGQELEGGYLWMGRPARRRRALTDEERSWFTYVAKHYAELKNDYLR